jgi:predicted nuclease of restriction endonuclease-like (RecB) superfamily
MTDQANTDSNFNALVASIANTSHHFQQQAQKQVNVTLTLRNWCIGAYLVEYEQHGQDRAQYGDKLLSKLAVNLRQQHIKGLGQTNLKLFRQFYMTYPHIGQTVSDQLPTNVQNGIGLLQSSTSPTPPNTLQTLSGELLTDAQTLINRLSFSHFIELLKADSPLKRAFYEVHTLQNNWSVRELQRAMNSMLYERTGLSTDKTAVLEKHAAGTGMTAQDVFRNPYMLEFLGLDEKTEYSESDLEQAKSSYSKWAKAFVLKRGKSASPLTIPITASTWCFTIVSLNVMCWSI